MPFNIKIDDLFVVKKGKLKGQQGYLKNFYFNRINPYVLELTNGSKVSFDAHEIRKI